MQIFSICLNSCMKLHNFAHRYRGREELARYSGAKKKENTTNVRCFILSSKKAHHYYILNKPKVLLLIFISIQKKKKKFLLDAKTLLNKNTCPNKAKKKSQDF